MASPTRPARLRIPYYNYIAGTSSSDDGKDIILTLKAARIQRDIANGADILNFPGLQNSPLAFGIIKYIITVSGVFEETELAHSSHPVTTSTEHDPDWIDFEEAALTFNNAARPGGPLTYMPSLEIDYGAHGDAWRIYKGVIQSLELVRREGSTNCEFTLIFAVAWSDSNPTLREWSS